MRWHVRVRVVAALVAAVGTACSSGAVDAPATAPATSDDPTTPPTATTPVPTTPSPTPTPTPTPSPTPTRATPAATAVPLHIESRVADVPTTEFRDAVSDVLTDPRGWQRAGFRFVLDAADAPYRLVLAEGPEVDQLCLPLDTYGLYSCQNGPVVALNADRWRGATPEWTGTLDAYRVMLVNHEVGHLLHLHHPRPQCPGQGLPAPIMAQQSTELGVCVANPWPLQWEVDLAAERREPLAPPADHDIRDHQPSPPAATE